MKINKNSKIFISGHKGMVGSSLLRTFKKNNFKNIITIEKNKLNLLNQEAVFAYLKKKKPDFVIIAAARAGGIYANSKYKPQFIYENLQIQNNLIHGSYLAGVKKLFFLAQAVFIQNMQSNQLKKIISLHLV